MALISNAEGWLVLPLLVLSGSVRASNPIPVGTLHSEGDVFLGRQTALTRSVVYGGDHLRTDAGVATITLARGNLLVLDRNTSVALGDSRHNSRIGLEKGRLRLAASAPMEIQMEADGLSVRTSGASPAVAELALRNDGTVDVAVRRGVISVANLRPNPVVLSAGQLLSAAVPVKAEKPQKQRSYQVTKLNHETTPPPPPPRGGCKPSPSNPNDRHDCRKGNNGVGNGVDPQPPGNPPINDPPGSGPGTPANRMLGTGR